MQKYKKLIRSVKSKYYPKVIEVLCPVRFYWNDDEYDGYEFGSLEGCSKYQIKKLKLVLNLLRHQMNCTKIVDYLIKKHPDEFRKLCSEIDADNLKIPQAFLEAFKDNKDES